MNSPKTPSKAALVQFAQWILDPVSYMEQSRQECGDIFQAKVTSSFASLFFVSHPEALQYILTHDRQELTAPGHLNSILSPITGDTSVMMLSGDYHKKRRQLLMPPFHGDRLRTYGDLIVNLSRKIIDTFPVSQVFSARNLMQNISLQLIMEIIFGLSQGERYEQIKTLLSHLLDIFSAPITASFILIPSLQKDLGAWSPWGKFKRIRSQIDAVLYAEIAERRQKSELGQDILSMLLTCTDEDGQPLTDKELRDELFLLLFAGHETTATAMSWGLYWAHHLPEVKAKILAELATLGDNPEPMSIARLPYLTAFCQETLRICPVAMLTLPRIVEKPLELQGYHFEPGNVITGCVYLTLHDESLYPEPDKFKPERFLERQYTPFEFNPFGGGARRCIGEALAMFEMKLVLATILTKYDLSLAEQKPEKPRRRGVTLAPERGVKMIMHNAKN